MKSLIFVCALVFVASSPTEPVSKPSRGCIYALGKCIRECPVGTHAYATGCGYKTPEPTCLEPKPVPEKYMICDYSACYCDAPTVKDEQTNQCVLLENCTPPKTEPTPEECMVEPPKVEPEILEVKAEETV